MVMWYSRIKFTLSICISSYPVISKTLTDDVLVLQPLPVKFASLYTVDKQETFIHGCEEAVINLFRYSILT